VLPVSEMHDQSVEQSYIASHHWIAVTLCMRTILTLAAAFFVWSFAVVPAQAAVTITFWSHELGNSFPHAFFSLRGVPDAGGAPVDTNVGFTAKSVSPALLMGPVAGDLDIPKPGYVSASDAQFSVVMSDAQYVAVLRLVDAWREGEAKQRVSPFRSQLRDLREGSSADRWAYRARSAQVDEKT